MSNLENQSQYTRTEYSIDEVAAHHHREWILLQVTEHDTYYVPSKGIVIATGPTRRSIQPAVLQAVETMKTDKVEHFVFFGHKRVPPGHKTSAALQSVVEREMDRGQRPG